MKELILDTKFGDDPLAKYIVLNAPDWRHLSFIRRDIKTLSNFYEISQKSSIKDVWQSPGYGPEFYNHLTEVIIHLH